MTFKDVIERVCLERNLPPSYSAEEIQAHIIHGYGLSKSGWLLMSHNYVRMLVEGAVWSMEHSWQRDKFERLVRLGP